MPPADPESVFTYGAPQLKFGVGAADEIGFDLSQYGVQRVLVVTDVGVAATGTPQRIADQMGQFGIQAQVFDGVHVEPTDDSLNAAIGYARASGPWDAFVAVGGGSAIDTAKAVNLLLTNSGELMDYVNRPVGAGRAPANPLKPLVAVFGEGAAAAGGVVPYRGPAADADPASRTTAAASTAGTSAMTFIFVCPALPSCP